MPPLDPEPNDEEKQEELSDEDTPYSLPTDSSDPLTAPDPQSLDPNLVDEHELYDVGLENAEKGSSSSPTSSPTAGNSDTEGFDVEPTG